jgi:hypothetical protein
MHAGSWPNLTLIGRHLTRLKLRHREDACIACPILRSVVLQRGWVRCGCASVRILRILATTTWPRLTCTSCSRSSASPTHPSSPVSTGALMTEERPLTAHCVSAALTNTHNFKWALEVFMIDNCQSHPMCAQVSIRSSAVAELLPFQQWLRELFDMACGAATPQWR